ncbi:MAG: phosphoheptose isomerase [Desulfuromonas sp.]|nr:MAG: phosphoheptose isomerase [Desulfuromonas sp.]
MRIDEIKAQIDDHVEVIALVQRDLLTPIGDCARQLTEVLGAGRKLLVMGNGGSAADAQHFAAELVGRFLLERRPLPAIALTTDTSILTAVGNDYGFEEVFSRQVEALAVPGDLVLGISTSGNSANVIRALEVAKTRGCVTAGLLGRDGGRIASLVDFPLTVPCQQTPRIQEAHQLIIHIICDLVEKELFAAPEGEG